MTFLEHLEELRRVLIDSIIALLVALAGAWFLAAAVQGFLIEHLMPEDVPVVALTVYEPFASRLKVAIAIALLIALPYIAWRVWGFVAPGLYAHERRMLVPVTAASTMLFYVGAAFGLLVLSPIVITILLSFGTGSLRPTIAINALLDFTLKLCIACGLVFQMPLVVTVLTSLGMLSSAWLLAQWRYAILAIFIIAALVTPGDGPTQLVVGVPVTALYFLSIGLARVVERRRQPTGAEDGEGDGGGDDDGDGDIGGGEDDGNGAGDDDGNGSGGAGERRGSGDVGGDEDDRKGSGQVGGTVARRGDAGGPAVEVTTTRPPLDADPPERPADGGEDPA